MRITESRLRRIIRQVIRENLDSLGSDSQHVRGTINFNTGKGTLFKKVCDFIENNLKKSLDSSDIVWLDQGMTNEKLLALKCKPFTDEGEDYEDDRMKKFPNTRGFLLCDFNIVTHSKDRGVLYKFNSVDEDRCKSFEVEADVSDEAGMDYGYGDIVLMIK